MNRPILVVICAVCCLFNHNSFAKVESETVRYARTMTENDEQTKYPLALLNLALSYSDTVYDMTETEYEMLQGRAMRELEHGTNIDVVWTMTSLKREAQLLPIRIPMYKGLYGYRIMLIRKEDQEKFAQIQNIEQLKELVAGQGHDWPDYTIMSRAGFTMGSGSNYQGLYGMLEKGRFDYFPRSVIEVWREDQNYDQDKIMIEQTLALHYPVASYFFVNPANAELAESIETGLIKAIEDGSFDLLFERYFHDELARANMTKRRTFQIDNPILPEETPIEESKYWFLPLTQISDYVENDISDIKL